MHYRSIPKDVENSYFNRCNCLNAPKVIKLLVLFTEKLIQIFILIRGVLIFTEHRLFTFSLEVLHVLTSSLSCICNVLLVQDHLASLFNSLQYNFAIIIQFTGYRYFRWETFGVSIQARDIGNFFSP